MNLTPDQAALAVERHDCPHCDAPAGSACRTRGGKTAAKYHTPRFVLVPALREELEIPVPADRHPGRAWKPGPALAVVPAPRTEPPVRIGYARASTARQELASQLEALHRAECHKVFKEQISENVHLARENGSSAVVFTSHLFIDSSFKLAAEQAEQVRPVPQWGLFETAPTTARQRALAWQQHIREVECGRPGGPDIGGRVREEYDPVRWTLAEREQAKAAELTELGSAKVSRTTVQRMRLAYRKQGLRGLLDHRATRGPPQAGKTNGSRMQ